MKLRTRTPGRPGLADPALEEEKEAVDAETPVPARRQVPRRSVAPRAPPEPPRPRVRANRAAPKGGVQKRKVSRATTRPRASTAPRNTTRTRRTQVDDDDDDDSPVKKCMDDEHDGVTEYDLEKAKEKLSNGTATIDDLPEEVMMGIFSYFRPPQLCWKIGRVCRQWASWSVSPFLWRGKDYILSPDPNLSSKMKRSK